MQFNAMLKVARYSPSSQTDIDTNCHLTSMFLVEERSKDGEKPINCQHQYHKIVHCEERPNSAASDLADNMAQNPAASYGAHNNCRQV